MNLSKLTKIYNLYKYAITILDSTQYVANTNVQFIGTAGIHTLMDCILMIKFININVTITQMALANVVIELIRAYSNDNKMIYSV